MATEGKGPGWDADGTEVEPRAALEDYALPRPPSGPAPGPDRGKRAGGELARVVGPGRLERRYLEKLSELELSCARESGRASGLARELETSRLLERGSQKLLDRMEALAADARAGREALEQREKRLILCLGGMQRENELLRERLALAAGRAPPALAAGDAEVAPSAGARRPGARRPPNASRGWLARLFGPR